MTRCNCCDILHEVNGKCIADFVRIIQIKLTVKSDFNPNGPLYIRAKSLIIIIRLHNCCLPILIKYINNVIDNTVKTKSFFYFSILLFLLKTFGK